MPTYPIYKLGDVAKIYNGNSINAEEKEKKYKGVDGRNYIGTKDIDFDCSVNYNNGVRIPYGEEKFKIAPAGSVLVCAEGGSAGKKSAFITEDVCFGNKLFAITNNQGLFDGKYVFYYTRYKRFFDLFKNELSGLIGGVSSKKFGEIPIPLPPLPTQHQIVSRIESLFAELDKAVEHLRTAQQQLKIYRQAVLNHWLNNDDGKWETVKLGEVAEAIDPEPSHRTPKIEKQGIPFISIKDCDYKTNTINFNTARLVSSSVLIEHKSRYTINEGDFIIGKIGTIGNPVNVVLPQDYALSANVVLIKATDRVNSKFLYNLFRSVIIEKQLLKGKKATTQAAFGIQKVRLLEIPLPSLSEQQRIVKEIETRLSQSEAAEARIAEALQKTEALQQSILKKAFSGEFDL